VDVNRVWKAHLLVCSQKTLYNLCGGDVKVRDRIIDGCTVLSPSPCFRATGVDDLDCISFGSLEQPGDVCTDIVHLVVFQVLKDEPVISKDRECSFVDDWSVLDLFMDVPCIKWRHCSFHDGGVSHPGVFIPGLEGGRD